MSLTIDIVIPSYRLSEFNLLPVLNLRSALVDELNFYLIVDNPEAGIPTFIRELTGRNQIKLLINPRNEGASYTRNRGIDAGNGQWILFLDDDLQVPANLLDEYASAVMTNPSETGFIGMVNLPVPTTDFSKAIAISGSMDIFGIAGRKKSFAWGATANIMIRRSALKSERFSLKYPKSGGGEDIDLFLRVREKNAFANYKTLPEASVLHGWWNDGRPAYKKFFRYGNGNSFLGELNPRYAYRDFLNTPEIIFLSLIALVISIPVKPTWIVPVCLFIAGALLIELIATMVQTFKRRPGARLRIVFYVLVIRMVYESGLLWGNIKRGRITGMGERFHDDGKTDKIYFYRTNTHKVVQWILYPVLLYLLIRFF